ncbi:sel1 repeat family protein [Campylobacter lari]|uniref:tetratricopeptide repeat protein n=1 Tax=Campylobacter lari TaxID=201 RepID=UPI0012CE0654|nr:sel1 repeat family protein [Campylobacter lari]EAL0271225.1 sel1 repeat family protein [Campylobacter lari]MCR6529056.1 sel1 repeat family protein [Campylobacter lari]
MKKVLIILAILFLNFAYSQEDLVEKGIKAYESGDYINAMKYYKKACDLNSGNGCFNLGAIYALGKGVRKDTSKALEYFGKACDLKDDLGCQAYARLKQ